MTAAATQAVPQQADLTIDIMVAQYVQLRDRLKLADDAHKEKTKPAREFLEKLNNDILSALNKVGGDSIKTPHGTAYRTEKKSATIADGEMFRGYVTDNALFDLVDWKANATAVAAHIDEHKVPPPGVNYTTTFVVGVRRK
jgi:hypothetical protein